MSKRRKKTRGRPTAAASRSRVETLAYRVALENAARVAGDESVAWEDALERLDAAVFIGARLHKTPDDVVAEWIDLSAEMAMAKAGA